MSENDLITLSGINHYRMPEVPGNKTMDKDINKNHARTAPKKSRREYLRSFLSSFPGLAVLFCIIVCMLLPVKNAAMLRWYDEMSYFSADMSGMLLSHPGGLIDFLGLFLTQLLFYPWLGTAVLLLLWVAVAYILSKVFRLDGGLTAWSFLPSFCLLLSVLSFDESWMSLRSYGSVFTPGLGMLVSSLLMWGGMSLTGRSAAVKAVYLLFVAALYPLVGCYAILAVAICVLTDVAGMFRNRDWRSAMLPVSVGLISAISVPLVYYYAWEGTIVDNDNLYIKGLPGFRLDAFDRGLWMPFAMMAALLAVYAVARTSGRWLAVRRFAGVVLFAGLAGYAFTDADLSSRQLRSTVAMLRYIDHNQWEHVGYVMEHSRCAPDLYMMLYSNMARQRLGIDMVPGAFPEPEATDNPRYMKEMIGSVLLSVPANYYLGKTHDSYRWAMENTVSRRESIFYLKYMVRNALYNGEYELARKYNDKIRSTLFHGYWAEHYAKYIDDPSLMKGSAEFNYIPEYRPKSVFLKAD